MSKASKLLKQVNEDGFYLDSVMFADEQIQKLTTEYESIEGHFISLLSDLEEEGDMSTYRKVESELANIEKGFKSIKSHLNKVSKTLS